jgi:tryptophan synthase alpha chain
MPLKFRSRPALVAYLTCGDPDLSATREIALSAIAAGADAIELGVPFSDPVADGPVIQRASERALRNGVSLDHVLKLAADIRRTSQAGLVIFSYFNPIMRMGLEKFAALSTEAAIDGALVTDLPVEEAGPYLSEMRRRHLDTVFLAAPTSTDERLLRIADCSTGFIYAVSRTGVTGAQKELPADAQALVGRLRKISQKPVAVGFGISGPDQFASVAKYADAAVIGSAIVQTIERNPRKEAQAVAEFIKQVVGQRSSAAGAQKTG